METRGRVIETAGSEVLKSAIARPLEKVRHNITKSARHIDMVIGSGICDFVSEGMQAGVECVVMRFFGNDSVSGQAGTKDGKAGQGATVYGGPFDRWIENGADTQLCISPLKPNFFMRVRD